LEWGWALNFPLKKLRNRPQPNNAKKSGGQIGNRGEILGRAKVFDTKKFLGLNLSKFRGSLSVGDRVEALVDSSRYEIAKHHSATHLLHAGLREILGEHVAQAGSQNSESRLRFDFSHPKPLSKEEIKRVEDWVNGKILKAIPRVTNVMSIDEAKERGALALFGEKYGDGGRVVQMGDSVELCGERMWIHSQDLETFYHSLKGRGWRLGFRGLRKGFGGPILVGKRKLAFKEGYFNWEG